MGRIKLSRARGRIYGVLLFPTVRATVQVILLSWSCLKKNQTTPRPSGHPPVMGGKMSKRLGGIKRLQIQNHYTAAPAVLGLKKKEREKVVFSRQNLNPSRPSEHAPVRGGIMSNCLKKRILKSLDNPRAALCIIYNSTYLRRRYYDMISAHLSTKMTNDLHLYVPMDCNIVTPLRPAREKKLPFMLLPCVPKLELSSKIVV